MSAIPRRRTPAQRWRATIIGLVLLLAAAYFAPHLASRTSLRHAALRAAAPGYKGELTVGSATLDWFSPVVLRGARAVNESGEPLFEAQRIACNKTLWSFLIDRQSLGEIVIEQPVVYLTVRDDGTNVEDALAQILSADSDSTVDCRVRIEGGAVEARLRAEEKRTAGDPLWTLHDVQAAIEAPHRGELRAKLTGIVEEAGGAPGKIDAELLWSPENVPWGRGDLSIALADAPLGLTREALRRLGQRVELAGQLTADCRLTWEGASSLERCSLSVSKASLRQFTLAAPAYLGGDHLQLETITGSGALSLENGRLTLDAIDARSELGYLQAQFVANWRELLAAKSHAGRLQAVDPGAELRAELDLARLARVVPETMRIREETRITSGVVSANLTCEQAGQDRRWQGELSAANLSAVTGGKPVTWEKPIVVAASWRHSPAGVVLEAVDCRSSFLTATGRGDATSGEFTAKGDLDRLAAELAQFIELGETRMAGQLELGGRWKRNGAGAISASVDGKIENLEFVAPGWLPWREKSLTLSASASGRHEGGRLVALDEAQASVEAGDDRFTVKLPRAVTIAETQGRWPAACSLKGELATWQPRLQTMLPLDDWRLRGAVNLSASGTASGELVDVQAATVQLDQFQARASDLLIYEPRVNVEGSGAYRFAGGAFTSPSITLRSATIAARVENVTLQLNRGGAPASLAGVVTYRGDLFRLLNWLQVEDEPPQRQWAGEFTGALTFARLDKATTFDSTTECKNVAWLERTAGSAAQQNTAWQPLLREPSVSIVAKGEIADERRLFDIRTFSASGFGWSVEGSGQVVRPFEEPRVDLQGRLRYDLAVLSEKLRPMLGGDLRAEGQQARTFVLRGPIFEWVSPASPGGALLPASASSASSLPESGAATSLRVVSRELTGEGGVGWTSAILYGLSFGPGALSGKLADGVMAFEPLEAGLGAGRLQVRPRIDLRRSPATLELEKGRLADKVEITPEMCQSWLKYVAPLVADATRAQGKISLDLAAFSAPLADPRRLTASGAIAIHGADIGPGPLSQQMLTLAHEIKALVERRVPSAPNFSKEWLRMGEQQVDFQVQEGRVFHRGLQMSAGDVVIRTQGSVGLDQSLSLVAEAPIQSQWIAREPLLSGFQGQSLKIPIRGTLSQPELDSKALRDVSKQLVSGAAEKLLQDEISKGLNRLLGPRKP